MNDRYLFKAKRIDWQEWVEECQWIQGNLINVEERYYLVQCRNNSNELWIREWVEVAPSTICQCTGLKDKNRTLIWENDVVKIGTFEYLIWWNREGQEMKAVPIKGICFNGTDYYSGYNPKFTYRDFIFMMQDPYGDFINKIEVIGSIIDNPELIEVEL